MATLRIITTPQSITIQDANDNRLIVRKTIIGIQYESRVNNVGVSKRITQLQAQIKAFILNPTSSKENYEKRFKRLAKMLNEPQTHSYMTLSNLMAKA